MLDYGIVRRKIFIYAVLYGDLQCSHSIRQNPLDAKCFSCTVQYDLWPWQNPASCFRLIDSWSRQAQAFCEIYSLFANSPCLIYVVTYPIRNPVQVSRPRIYYVWVL